MAADARDYHEDHGDNALALSCDAETRARYASADPATLAAYRDQAARLASSVTALCDTPLDPELLGGASDRETNLAVIAGRIAAGQRWRLAGGLAMLFRFLQAPAARKALFGLGLALDFEQVHLDVHYRSLDERLIAYSNKAFYESRLQTIRVPIHRRSARPPILLHEAGGGVGGSPHTRRGVCPPSCRRRTRAAIRCGDARVAH